MGVRTIVLSLMVGMLSGCAGNNVSPDQLAQQLVSQGHLTPVAVKTSLPVAVWGRINPQSQQPVHVYIEGDGHAWATRSRPSLDPTPHRPTALELAAADVSDNVVYIARPCQYRVNESSRCRYPVWTRERFRHVRPISQVLDQLALKKRKLILIGFSGGANIAIQMAAQRHDVDGLITVAGNLDSEAFNRFHSLPQEPYGRNGLLLSQLQGLAQLHLTGTQDRVIPPALTRLQLQSEAGSACVQIKRVNGADHHGPWTLDWEAFQQVEERCHQQQN